MWKSYRIELVLTVWLLVIFGGEFLINIILVQAQNRREYKGKQQHEYAQQPYPKVKCIIVIRLFSLKVVFVSDQ